jgi:hypothetical protein
VGGGAGTVTCIFYRLQTCYQNCKHVVAVAGAFARTIDAQKETQQKKARQKRQQEKNNKVITAAPPSVVRHPFSFPCSTFCILYVPEHDLPPT